LCFLLKKQNLWVIHARKQSSTLLLVHRKCLLQKNLKCHMLIFSQNVPVRTPWAVFRWRINVWSTSLFKTYV
jgi:hypothetical protein